jgi:nucleoside-diphosphate-sugar epimerase
VCDVGIAERCCQLAPAPVPLQAMAAAFVTGGSGFIGGRLIERLVAEGHSVRALARSQAAADAVAARGAEPVRGDLADVAALAAGASGCELAFHAAAEVSQWAPREQFVANNVEGTRNVIAGCRDAGVRRLVHVSTEAVLLAGEPLVNANEEAPRRPDSPAPYSATKAMAEELVVGANGDGLETVVVRPRFVWGAGDTTLLPAIAELVRAGRFAWIGGGRHLTSITHVDNVVEGLMLGAERGQPGRVYFVTDGDPVVFREFVSELLRTQGLEPPRRSIPVTVANVIAIAGETAWRTLPLGGEPPLTRFAVWASSQECTIDISRAGSELGYAPVRTRAEGLAQLRASAANA